MKLKSRLAFISCAALCSIAGAQTAAVPASGESGVPRASIALSPAIIMVRCKPGQSTTQTLTIVNHTADEVRFNLETEDVVVHEGKRSFSPAGRIANGIASSSVASPAAVVVKAGEEASVQVTFTLPPGTEQRAVVTFFRGVVVHADKGAIGLGASLGTLITFNVSSDYRVESGPLASLTPDTLGERDSIGRVAQHRLRTGDTQGRYRNSERIRKTCSQSALHSPASVTGRAADFCRHQPRATRSRSLSHDLVF